MNQGVPSKMAQVMFHQITPKKHLATCFDLKINVMHLFSSDSCKTSPHLVMLWPSLITVHFCAKTRAQFLENWITIYPRDTYELSYKKIILWINLMPENIALILG